jgi:4-amino-4-deoxy-L-arabinose transferase-like glycosyltransferase
VRVAGLLGVNALMLCAGIGVVSWLGVGRSWCAVYARCGLAYLCGVVVAAVLAATLALVHVSFGWLALALLAAVSGTSGAWHLRGSERPSLRRPSWTALAAAAALVALFTEYARAFAVAPLNRYDAWAIWALKGHALYAFGWADPAVFAGSEYRFANLDYPLLLPSLEAIDFRAMGAFDTRLVHLQFLLLLVAAVAALGALLHDRVPRAVLCLTLVAIALAPAVFDQLLTAYADMPLALVFAVGSAAAGRWLLTNERWALALAGLCFAGALLTKNEGTLFVVAVFVALLVVASRRWRQLAFAAAADVLLLLPWKLYVRLHDLHDINYSLTDSFDLHHIGHRLGVGPIAFRTLGGQMIDPLKWGLLAPLFVVLVVVGLYRGGRARRLAIFGGVSTLLSWLGLSWIYVISHFEYSAYLGSTKARVVASLVLAGAALAPLLFAETAASAAVPARRRGAGARNP